MFFFFQAEDGIRDFCLSRGLGDVYKRQASLTPTNVAAQIANVHTVFNVVTTIILLPIGTKLVDLSFIILPEKPELEGKMQLKYLDFGIFTNDYHIGTSAIANTQLFNETQNMLDVAIDNVRKSFEL